MPRENSLSMGLDLNCVPNLVDAVEELRQSGYDFTCVPICHPRYHRHLVTTPAPGTAQVPWTRSDVLLDSSQWSSLVVGKMSPWLDLDSPSERIRTNSAKAFWQEMLWAIHLTLPAVLLPAPKPDFAHYAHYINQVVLRVHYMHAWLRVPLTSRTARVHGSTGEAIGADEAAEDTWQTWNGIRMLCDNHSHLGVVLELTADLPSDALLDRWRAEPVRAVIVPTNVFLTNKSGYPALSRRHQAFMRSMFRLNVQVVLTGTPHHGASGLAVYKQYLQHLWTTQPPLSDQEQFEHPYLDYLQVPLQPLSDNLESQTYETFEKDPIKYKRYQEATNAAVLDMVAAGRPTPIVVMVVGAGRGPLVAAALAVERDTKIPMRLYAVEKNPNAVVTLRNKKASLGWTNVTIVDADMRAWEAPEKADILISELLGSFGDNELSPECLDGAQKFLKDDGISIPYEYTSYVAPLSSAKLYNEVKNFGDAQHFEMSYIVKFHNAYMIEDSKPVFKFVHPNRDKVIDNTRYCSVKFQSPVATLIHGLAGFFQAMLYKDINISIDPKTFSDGMFSWFPIFFPLKSPVCVAPGQEIEVHMWRQLNKNKVWYEWCLSKPEATPIQNPNGRSNFISLF